MTEEQLRNTVEERNMHIKHLEEQVKELTKQNYMLMRRISEIISLKNSNQESIEQ